MTTETNDKTTGNGAPAPSTSAADAKPKRVVKRKGLWLAIPKEYGDVVVESGEIESTPISYELYECATKAEVTQVLAKLGFDPKTTNPEHVKLFRADPIPLSLKTQVTLSF